METGIVTTHTAAEAFEKVLASAGCSKWRDEIDERIVRETRTGTATYMGSIDKKAASSPGIIDLPEDVMPEGASSPWVDLSGGNTDLQALLDTDGDGMPDEWEIANGLNPNDPSDANKDCTGDGYTNIEKYINGISTKHKVDWRDLKNNYDTLAEKGKLM